ncbi:hypothetical protein BC937DRAFT_93017 [Endogone sp. FLAS-F59071]|nr:hypothetical protein BC937DRAFT_93017 [Endogone sp. FLAS-F59071]|eukprot:RUS15021.1 hypothetical protein BC937DRAFT_93017 [Endogone sp. FLAS-F59071]
MADTALTPSANPSLVAHSLVTPATSATHTTTPAPPATPTTPTTPATPSTYLSTSPTSRGSHVSLFSATTGSTNTVVTHSITPQTYVRRVSFDTMTNVDLPSYSFTLQAKSQGYKRSKRSRCFLVATDLNTYSDYALEWTIERLVDDGDEVVVLRVVTVDMNASKSNIATTLRDQEQQARDDAQKVMDGIMIKNDDRQVGLGDRVPCEPMSGISIIVEFVVGKVQETIQNMISMYQPSMLIVGTRGRSPVKGFLLGSVSRYCLQHSPVPVTVVRPESRGQKYKDKKRRLSKLIKIRVGSAKGSKVDMVMESELGGRGREGSRSSAGSVGEVSLSTIGTRESEFRRSADSSVGSTGMESKWG